MGNMTAQESPLDPSAETSLGLRIIFEKLARDLVMYKFNCSDRFMWLRMILVWKCTTKCQTASVQRPPASERPPPPPRGCRGMHVLSTLHIKQFHFQSQGQDARFSKLEYLLTSETFAFPTHPAGTGSMVQFGQRTHHTLFACHCLTLFYLQILSTVGPPSTTLTKALASPEQMET